MIKLEVSKDAISASMAPAENQIMKKLVLAISMIANPIANMSHISHINSTLPPPKC